MGNLLKQIFIPIDIPPGKRLNLPWWRWRKRHPKVGKRPTEHATVLSVTIKPLIMGLLGFDCEFDGRRSESSGVVTLKYAKQINATDIDSEWEAVAALWTSEVLEGAVA